MKSKKNGQTPIHKPSCVECHSEFAKAQRALDEPHTTQQGNNTECTVFRHGALTIA